MGVKINGRTRRKEKGKRGEDKGGDGEKGKELNQILSFLHLPRP